MFRQLNLSHKNSILLIERSGDFFSWWILLPRVYIILWNSKRITGILFSCCKLQGCDCDWDCEVMLRVACAVARGGKTRCNSWELSSSIVAASGGTVQHIVYTHNTCTMYCTSYTCTCVLCILYIRFIYQMHAHIYTVHTSYFIYIMYGTTTTSYILWITSYIMYTCRCEHIWNTRGSVHECRDADHRGGFSG